MVSEEYINSLKNSLETLTEAEMQLQLFPQVQRYITIKRRIEEITEELAEIEKQEEKCMNR